VKGSKANKHTQKCKSFEPLEITHARFHQYNIFNLACGRRHPS
jgi:hypothetical protein